WSSRTAQACRPWPTRSSRSRRAASSSAPCRMPTNPRRPYPPEPTRLFTGFPHTMSAVAIEAEGPQRSIEDELRRFRRLGLAIVGGGLLAFGLWAGFAPLDEGVPAAGQVSIDTKRKAVQHATGGVVKAVHVKEGQQVAQGALLIELDAGVARANM